MPAIRAVLLVFVSACVIAEEPTVEDPIADPVEDPGPGPMDPTGPTGPSTETPAQAHERVLQQFVDCMQLGDFETANMAPAWANMKTANNSHQCQSCHAAGNAGFIASTNVSYVFDQVKSNRYFLLQYVTVDLASGVDAATVIPNYASFRAVAEGTAPHEQHPRFDMNGQGVAALETWVSLVKNRITAECAPPAM